MVRSWSSLVIVHFILLGHCAYGQVNLQSLMPLIGTFMSAKAGSGGGGGGGGLGSLLSGAGGGGGSGMDLGALLQMVGPVRKKANRIFLKKNFQVFKHTEMWKWLLKIKQKMKGNNCGK